MEQTYHKLGIIGYGSMGSYHHQKILKPANLAFTAACDIDPARRNKAEANGLKTYADIDTFLKESDIEAVLVSTPNHVHYDLALAALKAGKHVICEKPATMNADQFSSLMDEAEKQGVLLTCHQNRRMDRDYRIIQKILADKLLGPVFRIESRVEGSRGIADTWRRKKEFGGGMLYDWGTHLIDQMLQLTQGTVTSVFMRQQHLIPSDVDDNFRLELEFDTGLSALIEIGTCNFIMHPLWYVLGRNGSAQIDYWDLQGKIVQLTNDTVRWEDEIRPNIAGPSITMAPRSKDTICTLPLPEPEIDTGIFYRNFAQAIERTAPLWVQPRETLRVMQVIDLAFASAQQNQVLTCNI